MLYVDPYVKEAFRKQQPEGRAEYVRLDQNENPDGVPKWLFDEVMSKATPGLLGMYPEEGPFIQKYADMVGLDKANVTITDGSLAGMGYLVKVFGQPGKDIVLVSPTFNMYGVFGDLNGLKTKTVPYGEDYSMDVNNILAAIDENTSIVVLVNPNMPIGNAYKQEEIESVIQKAAKYNALVIVDEAYHYFFDGTSVGLIGKYDNLVILRTFSKMFALAGLRLGIVMSSAENIHYVNNWRPHYTVNIIALMFGEAIVDNREKLLEEQSAKFREGKEYVLKWMDDNGYEYIPSNGCFVCIHPKHQSGEYITAELKKRGILVLCGGANIDGLIRLSICGIKYMQIFTKAMSEIDRERSA